MNAQSFQPLPAALVAAVAHKPATVRRAPALSPALAMLCERTLSPMLAAVVAATEEGR